MSNFECVAPKLPAGPTLGAPGLVMAFAVVRWYPAVALSCGKSGASAWLARAPAAAVFARACRICG